MRVRTPVEFGLAIRDRRTRERLTQAELAQRCGVSRQWLVGLETGTGAQRAELQLVLRVLEELGLWIDLFGPDQRHLRSEPSTVDEPADLDASADLDAVLGRLAGRLLPEVPATRNVPPGQGGQT